MNNFNDLQKLVENQINTLNFDLEPDNLYKPIEYSLSSGGKRIRPVLALMAYELYRYDVEEAVKPATGLEVFHNFTLLHDDIMDKSDMRRGKPSVHKKYNLDIALLSGDAMSILATSLINQAPRNQQKIMQAFTRAALDVCEGQQYDMDFESREFISEDDYLKMISLKTSALLAVSLKTGGLMADAPYQDIDALYKMGLSLGLGFQLQDDWLDCFGNQEKFGKPIGKDILNQKKTLLWIEAHEKAEETDKKRMQNIIKDTSLNNEKKVDTVLGIYNKLGIPEQTRNTISSCFDEAESYLSKLSVADTKKTILRDFIRYIKNRTY